MKTPLVASLLIALAAATPAIATVTVTFNVVNNTTPVAQGSFTYADGLSGILGYDDLGSFSVAIGGSAYTLADVNSTLTTYQYFGYDTATLSFVPGTSCGSAGCGFNTYLSAIAVRNGSGFSFTSDGMRATDHMTRVTSRYTGFLISSSVGPTDPIDIDPDPEGENPLPVPEPATWAMLIAGFGLVGATMRRRRTILAA